jgi:hypothetical protein
MLSVNICPKSDHINWLLQKTSFKLHTTDSNYNQTAIHIKRKMAKFYLLIDIIP